MRFLQSVQQLSTSHSEAATIISRTEGKLDEIGGITRQTQLALHELADRFVHRENEADLRDARSIVRMTGAVEAMLQEFLAEHLSGIVIPTQRTREKSISMEAANTSGLKRKNVHHTYGQQSLLSEQDQCIADLSDPALRSGWNPDDEDIPHIEKTSKSQTKLGEVYIRTVSITYASLDEMAHATLPPSFETSPDPGHFPVTITKTDILLIPRHWSYERGATISCHHVSGPSSTLSDISFSMKTFRRAQGPSDAIPGHARHIHQHAKRRTEQSRRAKVQQSPLLMYTAFKTAFVANRLWKSKWDKSGSQFSITKPIPRNSFDGEINDAMDLVHLWLASGLDADFYKAAFPGDTAKTKEQCETIFRSSSTRSREFQRLRLEYVYSLVMETVLKSLQNEWNNGFLLDIIHQDYWDRCEALALSSSIAITVGDRFTRFATGVAGFYTQERAKLKRTIEWKSEYSGSRDNRRVPSTTTQNNHRLSK